MISIRKFISIQTILVVRLLVGLYCNISSNRIITLAARIYCAFISTIIVSYFGARMLSMSLVDPSFLVLQFIQYITSVSVGILTNGEYFEKFLTALEKIDFLLGTKPHDNIVISRSLFVAMMINKIFGISLFCIVYLPRYNCFSLAFVTTSGFLLDVSVDLCNFTRIIMFETMWRRMIILRRCFERELSVARRFESREKWRQNNLRKLMTIYNNLVESSRQCDIPMKFMVKKNIIFHL